MPDRQDADLNRGVGYAATLRGLEVIHSAQQSLERKPLSTSPTLKRQLSESDAARPLARINISSVQPHVLIKANPAKVGDAKPPVYGIT